MTPRTNTLVASLLVLGSLTFACPVKAHRPSESSSRVTMSHSDSGPLAAGALDLDLTLEDATRRARRWRRAWAVVLALSLVAQGVQLTIASSRNDRLDNLFGLIPPLTGMTILVATPHASLRAAPADEAPEITLARFARSERQKRNWFAHAGPIFLNVVVAALQLFVARRPITAGLQVGIGVTLSQTQLWTSPQVATRALR